MTATPRQILDMNAFRDDGTGGPAHPPALARRLANFGAGSVLFYRDPIEMVSGDGAWMVAADGTRYLDFYNNVPSVGHSHPKVVEAISRQVARLNINSRYLNPVVDDYAERLKETLPPGLSNLVLVCSGSEANDLALRIAGRSARGRGVIVTRNAYHGNTAAVTEISPSALRRGTPPDHVTLVAPPGADSPGGGDAAAVFVTEVTQAIARLEARGHGVAALICDTIFSSDGVHADPAAALAPAVARVRAAGGLFIADEVQPGFARTGESFWGFGRLGVTPDIVTMGKPMGNGFPMAGLATRPELLARFCEDVGYFNTFGCTPVAAAAGLAVLDVIAGEGLQENALTIGRHLAGRLGDLAARDARIGAVRGAGLFLGVDLCRDGAPDPDLATRVIDGLKEERILIGAAGLWGHTLKLRPPLCLTREEADLFADALGRVLARLPG